jgi:hypothetical protein
MPDREYATLKAKGEYPPVGVVSETQNLITFYSSFGLVGISIFLVVYVTTSIIRIRLV